MQRTAYNPCSMPCAAGFPLRQLRQSRHRLGDAQGVPPPIRVIAARLLRRAYHAVHAADIADDGAAVLVISASRRHVLGARWAG
jgi:hypothetical protein